MPRRLRTSVRLLEQRVVVPEADAHPAQPCRDAAQPVAQHERLHLRVAVPQVHALDEDLLVARLLPVRVDVGRVLLHGLVDGVAEGREVITRDDVVQLNVTVTLVGGDLLDR